MPHDQVAVWQSCLSVLKQDLHAQSYKTWIGPLRLTHLDPNEIILEAPDSFFCDWVDEHYRSSIENAVLNVTSWRPSFSVVAKNASDTTEDIPITTARTAPAVSSFPLNPRYRLDNFVVGDSNEFAFSAARAVAEAPGKTPFNPFVIYSGVGLGKTHLLQGIGDFSLKRGTAQNVVYVTAEKFISDYITSIRKREMSTFVSTYRSADLLLVDDIQFFLVTESSQREFFHTFNSLFQNDKQIVLSADCAPPSLKGFEPRLISRFQCGLVASIDSPDLETRIAILKHKADLQGFDLPECVSRQIAESHARNVRELEGALTRVMALSKLGGRPLTPELVNEHLPNLRSDVREICVEDVIATVCAAYGVSRVDLLGSGRKRVLAAARHLSMYLARELTDSPLKMIGSAFGDRDHSTVIHACKRIEAKIKADLVFAKEVEGVKVKVQTSQVA